MRRTVIHFINHFIWVFIGVFFLNLTGAEKVGAQSRQIVFRKITVEDGLSQNSVISIAQDYTGMMWLATQDGMNKYNGITFEKFDAYFFDITRPNFSRLGKIFIDSRENIWTITSPGDVNRISSVNHSIVSYPEVNEANCILEYGRNKLLLGTWGYGIYEYFPSSSQFIEVGGTLKQFEMDTIFTMHEDQDGILWIATQRGLFSYDGVRVTDWLVNTTHGTGNPLFIGSVDDHPDGILWLGSYGNGLYYKEKGSDVFRNYVPDRDYPSMENINFNKLNILDLMVDNKNRLWIATYGNGLFLIDGENPPFNFQSKKNNPNSISYNDILTLFEDRNNVIWAGTDGGGASYYDENLHKFNAFTNAMVPPDVNMDVIRSILVDREGAVWAGTSGKGLTKYTSKSIETWQTYKTGDIPGEGPSSNRIMSLAEDQDGDIWIGTQGQGLDIFSRLTGKFRNYYDLLAGSRGLPDHTIWCITPVEPGKCWLGTRNSGLILFDKYLGMLEQYLPDSSDHTLSSSNIRTVISDKLAGLWIGTEDNGICYFNFEMKSFTRYKTLENNANSLNNDQIKCLYLDSVRNMLWIGTSGGGLNALDLKNRQFHHYTAKDGLPNNVIYGIIPDEDNNLWMSTNRGICKFTPPDTNKTLPDVLIYDNYDGLQGLEFNTGAYFKDRNGYLYFGGIDGYNWFKPEEIEFNMTSPNTAIIGIDVNDQPLSADTVIEKKTHLLLRHDQDAISFYFSALSFSMPERNIYTYKLEGYDENWIQAGFRNFASYTNLDPGSYTFRVKGSNYDGAFDNEPAYIHITILRPWWGTYWAYMIYGLLIAVFGLIAYRVQKRRWQLQTALEYEQHEAERLKELDEFKSRVYANITHEFRTPLTVIQGLTERAREYARKGQMAKFSELIDIVRRNGDRLLQLVNQVLDLSRLESKSLRLDYVSGDIVAFIKYSMELVESFASTRDVELRFNSTVDSFTMDFDNENFQKVLNNLISNAIKFTPKGGKVVIEADVDHDGGEELLKLTIRDTGIGIPEKDIPHLFERFYQVSRIHVNKYEGSGIGLALTKELVQLMEGDIQVESTPDQGTVFRIRLPVFHRTVKSYQGEKRDGILENDFIQVTDVRDSTESTLDAAKVLLIEDNKDVLYYLKTCLNDQFQVLEALQGQQGIAIAFEQIPDLIITDVMMPGMDGFEVCEALKNDQRTSHIPVIMLTAKASVQDKIEGLKTGADAYLYKPFNIEELTVQIENLLIIRRKLQEKFSTVQDTTSFDSQFPFREKQFITRLNELIEKELSNPDLSVDTICEQLYMSRTQLHRKVKALTDRSITAYVRKYRLTIAGKLIKTTDKTISEIAFETGFNDPSYFHRSFQQEFGMRPGDLRKPRNSN